MPKILLMSAVPTTLWAFYHKLIKVLKENGYDVTICSSPGEYLDKFETEMNCRIFPVDIHRKISPIADIKAIYQLNKHLRKEKYDIIHAHTPKAGMIGMIAGFISGTSRRIYTMHGMPLETAKGIKRKILRFVERQTFNFATHRLIVSHSLAKRSIEEKICKRSEYQVLADGTACGIDRDRFNSINKTNAIINDTKRKCGICQDSIVIGFVGRIVPDKGIICLLDAFDILLQRKIDNVYLLILGEYEVVRESISLQTRQRIETNEKIIYGGNVDDVVPYYYVMDMLVLPSKREGFNYVLMEAAACGLPVVTTRATGCVDAVVDNHTGYIVGIENSEQLADAMQKLVEDAELRQQFGLRGEQRVDQQFSAKRLVKEHLEFYSAIYNSEDQS